MTKDVTFTFEKDTGSLELRYIKALQGPTPIDVRNDAISSAVSNVFTRLIEKNAEKYQTAILGLSRFTVTFSNGAPPRLKVESEKGDVEIHLNKLSAQTAALFSTSICTPQTPPRLKDSLDKVTSITTAPTSPIKDPYLPSFKQTQPLIHPEKSLQNPKHFTAQASKVAPPSHGIVYRFFAAIGNFFMNLFSSDTSEKPKPKVNKYATLISKEHKATSSSTPASTAQAKTDQLVRPGVDGIRPLPNEGNTCFINAVFQALMNIPEMVPTLIAAHNEKIAKETKAIEDLQAEIALEENAYFFSWSSTTRGDKLSKLEASREASITLNQALRIYNDRAKDPVRLKALRGFIPGSLGGSRQEDANDLLVKIFDPLLEPLRNGVNTEGRRDLSTIPTDIDPALRDSLGRFIPKFGEEKQLQLVAATETRALELAALDYADPLPHGGLKKGLAASSILPFAIPNTRTTLQDLITEQLKMQKPAEQDDTSVYVENGVRGDYQVSQKRSVIEFLGNPPEFVSIQLKRFNRDGSKNNSAIVLPKNNKIRLVVNGKNVDYEIQTLVMHSGTPDSGHYFSYVRKNGAWFEANDSYVGQLLELPASVEKEAYLIVLKRVQ